MARNKSLSLSEVLTEDMLAELAGDRAFARGEDYFARGLVRSLAEYRGVITAQVQGTEDYKVKLWAEGDELGYDCTCPAVLEWGFCKHCVAVGLAWLKKGKTKKARPGSDMDQLRAYLSGLDAGELVDLLMAQAMEDEHLRLRLTLKAGRAGRKGTGIAALRRAIDQATLPSGEWSDAVLESYEEGLDSAVEELGELLDAGQDETVIELAERALSNVVSAVEDLGDPSGPVGEALEVLLDLHHRACRKAKPDPLELAERLLSWELDDPFGLYYDLFTRYQDVLGKKGQEAYRRQAQAAWDKLQGGKGPPDESNQDRLQYILEEIAAATGGMEAVIDIKSRNLREPHDYRVTAEMYLLTQRPDKALEICERGLKAFPNRPDPWLRSFVQQEYVRLGRKEEAMQLAWDAFKREPHYEGFRRLRSLAEKIEEWPTWRPRAFDLLRRQVSLPRAARDNPFAAQLVGNVVLVRLLLEEGAADEAWEQAKQGGIPRDLELELVGIRAKTHPADALPVFKEAAERAIATGVAANYPIALEYLGQFRSCLRRVDRLQEFKLYVAGLRNEYRSKRKLMQLLDDRRW